MWSLTSRWWSGHALSRILPFFTTIFTLFSFTQPDLGHLGASMVVISAELNASWISAPVSATRILTCVLLAFLVFTVL